MADTLLARGISQRFGERIVLEDVDLEVPAGRVIGLLGPNGAGKTTLMRILFGVLQPDAGTVEWRGHPADDDDRRSWGYMPQERGLYRDMRVLDQITWIARLHGLDKATGARRAADLLERLGLDDRAKDKVQDLSGGMAQRVQLATAMVHDPEVLVLDEPFSGLDPGAVEFLSDVILDHVRRGRSLLLSSHQLDLVEDLCETITLINHGRVVLRGDVRALKAASPDRYLRVDVAVEGGWVRASRASVAAQDASGTRLRLEPGADAGAVLDAVRAHTPVGDFAVESPSLSELFLAATGEAPEDAAEPEAAEVAMSRWLSLRLVAGRELREAFRRRTFWIVVGLLVAASTAGVVLPEVIGSGRTSYDVAVVEGTPGLERQLEALGESLDVEVHLANVASATAASQLVAGDDADIAVVAGDRPSVIAKEGRAESFVAAAEQVLGVESLGERLQEAGLTPVEVRRAMEESQAKIVRLNEDESSRQGSAAIVAIVLYLLLLMLMMQVANGTAIEKANRISEVLLAIVRPGALLFGKVLGVGIVGLLTLLGAMLPPVVKLIAGGDLPAGLGTAIVVGAPWFLLGLVLYLTTAGALGALVERQEEAGSVVTPLTVVLIGAYLVAQSASGSPLGQVLAIIPFTSPMVMPSRIAVGVASGAEMALSLGLGLATVFLAVRIGARIYARVIVRTGRRLKLREVLA